MPLLTPVAFLIYNRPDLTERVFEAIKRVQPSHLYVIADGPRSSEDEIKCNQTRSIIHQIDWKCDVHTNFSDTNLGCGRRESSGFDWVFSHVEEAIFLEDDTLPDPSFFLFCERMLHRYRHDQRIMHVTGNNFQKHHVTDDSYYFSKYMHAWGWASWRRAWRCYDYEMKSWPKFREAGCLHGCCHSGTEERYWQNIFDKMHQDPQVIDTWDYQWLYACWSQHGLVVTPKVNLVSNIGFNRPDAAHTRGDSILAQFTTNQLKEPFTHPSFFVPNVNADRHIYQTVFGGEFTGILGLPKRLQRRAIRHLKMIFHA